MRFYCLFGYLTLLLMTVSCTRGASNVSRLNIQLPKMLVSQNLGSQALSGTDPTSVSEINCFMVVVGGGTPDLKKHECSSSQSVSSSIKFGHYRGLVRAGSSISVEVSSGPERTVTLLGVKAANESACKDFSQGPLEKSELSALYSLATKTLDLTPGENTVELTAQLDLSKSYDQCSLFSTGGESETPLTSIVLGQTDPSMVSNLRKGLKGPKGVHLGASGKLYVVDQQNNRVLIWNSGNHPPSEPDIVLGQPNSDYGGPSSPTVSTLSNPSTALEVGSKLIVADSGNGRLLIWNSLPTASNTAADLVIGKTSFSDNTLSCASGKYYDPSDMVSDGTRLFVSDRQCNRIYWYNSIPTGNGVTPDGVLGQTTLAGTGNSTTQTTLHWPTGLAIQGTDLWVADRRNARLLRFDLTSPVTGDSANCVLGQNSYTAKITGTTAQKMNNPLGLVADGNNLYVSDLNNYRILRFNVSSAVCNGSDSADLVIGQTDFSSNNMVGGASAMNGAVYDLEVRNGKVYTVELAHRLRIWNTIPTTNGVAADVVYGQPDYQERVANNPDVSAQSLHNPEGIAISPDSNQIAIADRWAHRVLIWNTPPTSNGQPADHVVGQTTMSGSEMLTTPTDSSLALPTDAILVNGKLIVADQSNNRVLIWNTIPSSNGVAADVVVGQPDFITKTQGSTKDKLYLPSRVYSDGTRLFVSDQQNHRVLIWNTIPTVNGVAADVQVGAGSIGNSANDLKQPGGVVTHNNKLFVADRGNHRVLIWNSVPTSDSVPADLVVGQTGFGLDAINSGDLAHGMNFPQDVQVDGQGRLYVSESGNHRVTIRNAIPTTNGEAADSVIGQPDLLTNTPNSEGLSMTSLNGPMGISIKDGFIYIADSSNYRVVRRPLP